jgi:hypothetical protein
MTDDDRTADHPTDPLEADREGEAVHLSGTAQDLEELGQAVTAASADPDVDEVDVGDVDLEQPDSGLWR